MSKVHVWYMTEEQRLAYIKKHPIVPTKNKAKPKKKTTDKSKKHPWGRSLY